MSHPQWVETTEGIVTGPDLVRPHRVSDVFARSFDQVDGPARVSHYLYVEFDRLHQEFVVMHDTQYLPDRDVDADLPEHDTEVLGQVGYYTQIDAEEAASRYLLDTVSADDITWDGKSFTWLF